MESLTNDEKLILLQYAILKYGEEGVLIENLRNILEKKDIDRGIDTLIGTQRVKRVGTDTLQNNVSHTGELPALPSHLESIVSNL